MHPSPGTLSLAALQRIEAATVALLGAVRQAQGELAPSPQSLSLPSPATPAAGNLLDVCNEFMLAKARAGRADSYLANLLTKLRSFTRGRERRALASISGAEIEVWLHSQAWSPKTQRVALLALRTLFQFAVSRGFAAVNAALSVDLPAVVERSPALHTPNQVRAVLRASGADPHARRCLAVRYFAGLRRSEAVALAETEIHAERGFIEVTAAKAKTRRRRLVPIQPNLAAWLALGGELPLRQSNNRLSQVTKAAGIECPAGVCRHSFVSYAVPVFGAATVALWAGHSEQMLFNVYRELVTPQAAAEFWAIRPDGA